MSKVKELLKSGHIHVALALGASIIVLAYFSKRVLDEPMRPIYHSITSFFMLGYETLIGTKKKTRFTNSLYWVSAIIVVTVIIIIVHLL